MSNVPTIDEAKEALIATSTLMKYLLKYWPMCDTTDIQIIKEELECEVEELQ